MTDLTKRVQTVRDLVEKNKAQLTAALPGSIPGGINRFVRVFFSTLSTTPKLYECTPRSLLGALIQSAQLGLEPGVLGRAYFVPFKGEVQFMPGYLGLLELVRRSGEVSTVMAHVVHAKDAFKFAFGLTPVLEHTPSDQQDCGPITHVYAVIRLKDGGVMFDVMTKHEVDAHRDRYSRAAQNGPWVTAYEAMAKKTVLKRVAKLAPVSIEAHTAITLSEKVESQLPQHLGDALDLGPEDEAPKGGALDTLAATMGEASPPDAAA